LRRFLKDLHGRGAVTPERTAREADFLAFRLELRSGMSALDVPWGNGRRAIKLARRGVRMTCVDISVGFLDEGHRNAPAIEWIQGDMRKLPWRCRFDSAYCWGNSFGYFDHDNCQRFLEAIASVFKPGGRFILEKRCRSGIDLSGVTTRAETADRRSGFSQSEYLRRCRGPYGHYLHLYEGPAAAGQPDPPVGAFGDVEGARYALGSSRFIALARRAGPQSPDPQDESPTAKPHLAIVARLQEVSEGSQAQNHN
jgi:SAM-dependent methyltransferase